MTSCDKEAEVLDAVRRDTWAEALRAHVEECPLCSDLVIVSRFLQDEARLARTESAKALPSPGFIWWKAQILAKRTAIERATRPIAVFERIAYGVGALSLLGLAAWNWGTIVRWLEPLRATWNQMSSLGATPLFNPFVYLSAGFLLLVLLLFFALYVVWVES